MEQIIGIAIALALLLAIASALLSWRGPAVFLLILSVLDLHLMLPIQINIEDGVTIHGGDLFFSALAVVTLFRLFSLSVIGPIRWLWLAFACYLGLTFLHGVSAHGFLTAAASYRDSLYLSIGTAYFSTFDFDEDRLGELFGLILLFASGLALWGIVTWSYPELRPTDTAIYAGSVNIFEQNRALPAQAAMFIALGFLASLPAWLDNREGLTRRLATLPLLAAVVLLFHRSIWVATAVAVAVLPLFMGRRAARILVIVQGAALILVAMWLLLEAMDVSLVSESMRSAVNEVTETDHSSLTWRIEGWRILVDRAVAEGPLTILLGSGFGIGFERTIDQSYVVVSPHNVYVEMFLTGGLMSCALFVSALGLLCYSLHRRSPPSAQAAHHVLVAMIIAQAVYGISYSPHYDCAPLLGAALSIAARLNLSARLAPVLATRR